MDNQTATIRAHVTTLNVRYKQMTSSFGYMTPTPPRPEVDPDYVHVAFSIPDLGEMNDCSGSMTLRKEEVRRLGLMVGDAVTISINKEQK
jgi:hypothetical protein